MKNRYKSTTLGLLILIFLLACQPQRPETVSDFLSWMSNPDNGLVKENRVNGIEYRVNFLPSRYLQLMHDFDELGASSEKRNNSGVAFLLTISTEKEGVQDVLQSNVIALPELSQRIHDLNFELDGAFHLLLGESVYPLGIYNLENVYNVRVAKQIYLVFDLSIEDIRRDSAETLSIRYIDEVFETGIQYFVFDKEDLLAIS